MFSVTDIYFGDTEDVLQHMIYFFLNYLVLINAIHKVQRINKNMSAIFLLLV